MEPIANSTPIHHDARLGAHQTPVPAASARESSEWRFRCAREDHVAAVPSGFKKEMCVVNGPIRRRAVSVQSWGASG